METLNIAAIDLGASSGRVMLATYGTEDESIQLREVHRFKNQLQEKEGHTCWDLQTLEQEILCGLKSILEQGIPLHSLGIDTWGVDYVLLDKNGNIVGPTYAYRDHRTHQVMPRVFSSINKETIYNKTGIQFLTFNTLFQLKAMVDEKPCGQLPGFSLGFCFLGQSAISYYRIFLVITGLSAVAFYYLFFYLVLCGASVTLDMV